jgi:hypothetical protein
MKDNNPNHEEDARTRRTLAYTITALAALVILISIVIPSAASVLDKVLPLLTLIIGYFFGQQHR